MTEPKQLDTPVLLIVFNRPETTAKVFAAIREARPRQLFVAADGPRPGKEGEAERCRATRELATAVDWPCELKTFFRDENVGCGRGPAGAITWFFEQVEQGIILEDDCLPNQSFFPFCEEMLNKYRDNPQIRMVSGFNRFGQVNCDADYLFSKWSDIWGWATWRRAWRQYDLSVPEWKDQSTKEKVEEIVPFNGLRESIVSHLDKASREQVDYWDFQWLFYRLKGDGLGVVPRVSLIRNIGFGEDATHTFSLDHELAQVDSSNLHFPLEHPKQIVEDKSYEQHLKEPNDSVRTRFQSKLRNIYRRIVPKS